MMRGFVAVYLLQIYGLVIISGALLVLALYLMSLLVIHSVHRLIRRVGNVLPLYTAFVNVHSIRKGVERNRAKLHLN